MRLATWLLLFAGLASAAAFASASPPTAPADLRTELGEHARLRVLYAGALGEPRAEAFVEFLARVFEHVDSIELESLTAEVAAPFDVVVADWRPNYVDGLWGQGARAKNELERDFPVPTLLIGDLAGTFTTGTKLRHL